MSRSSTKTTSENSLHHKFALRHHNSNILAHLKSIEQSPKTTPDTYKTPARCTPSSHTYLLIIIHAAATTLLSAIRYVPELLLETLFAYLAKLYHWDLGGYIPAVHITEVELWCLGNLRANFAEMGLLAPRTPQGFMTEPVSVLDAIRDEQDEEDWDNWLGWEEEEDGDDMVRHPWRSG
ncbi:hypothetical protein CC86DRAFT_403224 [Ophiobolus disseminans]|uniref:Uncharacterized protein n=1 Tax=Ophiobolus disseminans TaxID=1469910 RepID=A0A6A7AB31_9PLEO|nr:hypothetical protein CC86DRAFT_403224 [Ophiobolus disseminans]